jgi:hypothetical protein
MVAVKYLQRLASEQDTIGHDESLKYISIPGMNLSPFFLESE